MRSASLFSPDECGSKKTEFNHLFGTDDGQWPSRRPSPRASSRVNRILAASICRPDPAMLFHLQVIEIEERAKPCAGACR